MVVEDFPAIWPWTLLRHYVKIISHLVPMSRNTFVLRALCAPFLPVCKDNASSLTTHILDQGGVNTKAWGLHSTRGAAVRIFKEWKPHSGGDEDSDIRVVRLARQSCVGQAERMGVRRGSPKKVGNGSPFVR